MYDYAKKTPRTQVEHFMKKHFLMQIIFATAAAIICGFFTNPDTSLLGLNLLNFYGFISQLFLNALSLVVVPLIVSSIITGSSRLGKEKQLGSLGLRSIMLFITTNLLAVLVGFFLTTLLNPGASFDASLLSQEKLSLATSSIGGTGLFARIQDLLFRLIPPNIIAAASEGQMLGIVIFSLFFGLFSSKIEPSLSDTVVRFWSGMFQVMMRMTEFVMRALPVGVFGMIAKVVTTSGLSTIRPVLLFFTTIVLALAVYSLIILPLLLKGLSRHKVFEHFRTMTPALVTAFTTSSTAATLPITMETLEVGGGISNRICSFILPLGTSINLAGSALYVTGSVIFIAQAYGMPIDFSLAITVILMGTFAGLGMVAGIPSASLVTIVVVLRTIGLPDEGVVLVLAVDRILDMLRTVVSVLTNSCCAVIVNDISPVNS